MNALLWALSGLVLLALGYFLYHWRWVLWTDHSDGEADA